MSQVWKRQKLADLCEVFADGDWIESKDQSDTGIRLIQTGNVGCGTFKDRGDKARYISVATFQNLRCTEIFEGDCLVSRLPDPAGRSCILPDTGERMITAVDCTIIRFNTNKVIPEFFNYYTQSRKYLSNVDSETTGTTRKRISRSKLAEVGIPVPPLLEQRRIVAILDEAFEGLEAMRANAEKNLKNARELFDCYLNAIFTQKGEGWVEMRLDHLGRLKTGTTPKTVEAGMKGNFISFIKPGDFFKNGELDYENEGLSQLGLSKSRLIQGGSALMVCIGATIGKAGYCERDIATNQQINSVTPSKGISGKFTYYQMLATFFQEQVVKNSGQATLPIINKSKWGALTMNFPATIEEQEIIVNKLEELSFETERLEAIYRQKLAAIAELKQSLLQKAFAGELTSSESIAA